MNHIDWWGVVGIAATLAAWLIDRKQVVGFLSKHHKIILTVFAIAALFTLWERGGLNWLFHRVNWPLWALILLGLSGLLFALAILAISELIKQKPPAPPDPFEYITDEILGVQWVWGYRGVRLNEDELSPFCPKQECKCRLAQKDGPMASGGYYPVGEPRFSLSCPKCGFMRDFDLEWRKLKHDVFVEIERRIRTGEYVERMQRQTPRVASTA